MRGCLMRAFNPPKGCPFPAGDQLLFCKAASKLHLPGPKKATQEKHTKYIKASSLSPKGSPPCTTKAATPMVKAAGMAAHPAFHPTTIKAGATNSDATVSTRETSGPSPMKS